MRDREEIAKRHGIGQLADQLAGETREQLESDVAARASHVRMFAPRNVEDPEPPEPPIDGEAPKDKEIADYTDSERAALHQSADRAFLKRAESDEDRRRQAAEREEAEATRTDEQRMADAAIAALRPGAKRSADAELIDRMFCGGEQ